MLPFGGRSVRLLPAVLSGNPANPKCPRPDRRYAPGGSSPGFRRHEAGGMRNASKSSHVRPGGVLRWWCPVRSFWRRLVRRPGSEPFASSESPPIEASGSHRTSVAASGLATGSPLPDTRRTSDRQRPVDHCNQSAFVREGTQSFRQIFAPTRAAPAFDRGEPYTQSRRLRTDRGQPGRNDAVTPNPRGG